MPFINGRFYMNPAFGRSVESARAESAPEDSPAEEQDGRWVTVAGRHILLQGAQTGNKPPSTGDRIAATAKSHAGSTMWGFDKRKGNFAPGTNKCNKFVYDVIKEAGADATVIGGDGRSRPPLAGEWANASTPISGWRVLGSSEIPRPGDVAAYKLSGGADYTGHSGIVTSVDATGVVHAIAAHYDVVGQDEKFNVTPERGVTYRRYSGGR